MDDLDISFDFESNLNAGGTDVAALPSTGGAGAGGVGFGGGPAGGPSGPGGASGGSGALMHASGRPKFTQYVSKKNFRQTVCRHWLRGLCMKGEQCGFLHQFDQSRMPICRFFAKYGVCREPECVFKHSTEEVKECNMFNLGFCIHGPLCRYKHVQRPGPPPPPETVEQAKPKAFRNVSLDSKAGNNYRRQYPQIQGAQQPRLLPSTQSGGGASNSNNFGGAGGRDPQCIPAAPPPRPPRAQPQAPPQSSPPPPPPPRGPDLGAGPAGQQPQAPAPPAPPREDAAGFLRTEKCRFFVVHVRNRKDLSQAFSTNQWPTNLSTRMKLNEAFSTVDNILLVFVDVSSQGLCGFARMEGVISKPKTMVVRRPGGNSGSSIPLKWLSRSTLPASQASQLLNKWNDNKPLVQARDSQEVDTETGGAALGALLSSAGGEDLGGRKRPRS
ncbi:30-kDa cleavage and polyadenylation specificity factor 30 [Chloropicon primus]|nr:30-kDa cleavage and polyadenylation specificity factor 30 [Chloropicon primus]